MIDLVLAKYLFDLYPAAEGQLKRWDFRLATVAACRVLVPKFQLLITLCTTWNAETLEFQNQIAETLATQHRLQLLKLWQLKIELLKL